MWVPGLDSEYLTCFLNRSKNEHSYTVCEMPAVIDSCKGFLGVLENPLHPESPRNGKSGIMHVRHQIHTNHFFQIHPKKLILMWLTTKTEKSKPINQLLLKGFDVFDLKVDYFNWCNDLHLSVSNQNPSDSVWSCCHLWQWSSKFTTLVQIAQHKVPMC